MGRHKLIKDEPQEEVLEVTFDDGEKVKDEPQEEVVKVEEKKSVSYRGTGRFECKLHTNGYYFVVSPEGKIITPYNLSEDRAKDFVFRFNK